MAQAAADISAAIEALKTAQRNGDFEGQGRALADLQAAVDAYQAAQRSAGVGVTRGGHPDGVSRRDGAGAPRPPSAPAGRVVRTDAGWSSSVARWAHNPEVAGSNPAPATTTEARPLWGRASAFSGSCAATGSDRAEVGLAPLGVVGGEPTLGCADGAGRGAGSQRGRSGCALREAAASSRARASEGGCAARPSARAAGWRRPPRPPARRTAGRRRRGGAGWPGRAGGGRTGPSRPSAAAGRRRSGPGRARGRRRRAASPAAPRSTRCRGGGSPPAAANRRTPSIHRPQPRAGL